MKLWILFCLVGIGAHASAADAVKLDGKPDVKLGCKHLRLVLDPQLGPETVLREWGKGTPPSAAPAVLELRGCKGQLLDRLTLEGPLARLHPEPLRGAPAPTYLVSVDLTAEAGSYSGPLTIPIQVVRDHLIPATAHTADGKIQAIHLALTGKAAWKKVSVGKVDDLLAVDSEPKGQGFITHHRRYHPSLRGWQVQTRSHAGLWESDGEFPATSLFP